MQSRLPLPDIQSLNPEQKAIHDSILATRGNLSGPFLAWMHSPELASHAEKLGAFCRYKTGLPLVESELLILCVAARFQCVGEQQIHEPIAAAAGVPTQAIADLRQGLRPQLADPRQQLLADLARELLSTNRLSPASYAQASQVLGERLLVEVVGVLGYYALVALTLNAFEMQL